MRNILAILFGLMLASGALANEQAANLDQDQDGLISREEASADQSLADSFDELDADGDGYLSADELNGSASE
jgi:Ca2+-binding EF-hand superfamily protein